MSNSMRTLVKSTGDALSAVIMSNMILFMAYGLANVLFSKAGYFPITGLQAVLPFIGQTIIPLAVAFSSGNYMYEKKGGLISVIITSGLILNSIYLNILGIVLLSFFFLFLFKKIEKMLTGRFIGFEMLTTNLVLIFYSLISLVITLLFLVPMMDFMMGKIVFFTNLLTNNMVLSFFNVIIEPAKVFNLNNIVNSVFLTPVGLEQASSTGASNLFFLEANPGPGLGVLLAYSLLTKGQIKKNTLKSSAVHFIGGIHELYFPYVLMNPKLFVALIAGGMSGTAMMSQLSDGLVSPLSPGSILTILLLSGKGNYFAVISSIAVSIVITFLISFIILKWSGKDYSSYALKTEELKLKNRNKDKVMVSSSTKEIKKQSTEFHKIIFACDAGMGSSAIGASILRKKLDEKKLDISVENSAIKNLKEESNVLIITQTNLAEQVKHKNVLGKCVTLVNYLDQSFYDEIVSMIEESKNKGVS